MNKGVILAVAFAVILVAAAGYFSYRQFGQEAVTQTPGTVQQPAEPETKALYNSPEEKAKMSKMWKDDNFMAPRTHILFQVLKVEGALSKVDAERSFLFQQSQIRGCYLNALSDDQSLAGSIALHFEADPKGKLTSSHFDSEIKNEGFLGCIKPVIESWPFPSSSDEKPMVIDASLALSSSAPPTPEEIIKNAPVDDHDHGHGHQH